MENFFAKTYFKFGVFVLVCFVFCFPLAVLSQSEEELRGDLNSQINSLQQQIDVYRNNIKELQKQSKSLKQEVSLLDAKMKSAELEIKRTNLSISQVQQEIDGNSVGIREAEAKLKREKELLGEHLRLRYEYDQKGVVDMLLSKDRLSDAFDELASLENIQSDIQESMAAIIGLKDSMEASIETLEDKKEELNGLKVLQQIQRLSLDAQQTEKESLLAQTRGQESNYQALVSKAQSDINSIKQQLYLLDGVGVSMPLYNAYQYAKTAGDLTGVRPAFLLAILKKETSWGEKVGTGTWRKDMHTRDQQAFVQICEELGRDPDAMPVSKKPSYGWGGAMGPAQFLPSTWLGYKDRIAQLTGHNPPDPWDIGDAFTAAAIKLAQNGANARTEAAEWKAAQLYFAGSRWNNPTYYFYGDQVMELTGVIQEQLNLITK